MIEPYRMVVVNLIASITLIAIFFLYRRLRPKKIIPEPLIIFTLSLLPLISLLRKGTYESGDLSLHATRFLSFYNSLKAGILIPQWSHDLNAGYGYPLFIFVQTFPNHIASIFHFLGFSMIDSIKILFALSFIVSGLGMYYFLKEFLPKQGALIGALLYLFAPYHLVDMHFRANPGEVLSFAFFPLAMLSLQKLYKKINLLWFDLFSLNVAFVILSHPIAIVLIPFIVLYLLFLSAKKKNFKFLSTSLSAIAVGFLISAYYWLPEITLSKFTHQAYYHKDVIFVGIKELLYSPWRFGLLYQGHFGELSFLLGYPQLLLLIYFVFLLYKKRLDKRIKPYAFFFLITFFITIFSMLSVSKPLWDVFFIFHNLQFTYRLLVLVIFIVAVIGSIAVYKIKSKKIIYLIILVTVFGTMLNWGNRRVIPQINDSYLQNNIPYASKGVEGSAPSTPIWLDPKDPWQKNPRITDLKVDKDIVVYKTVRRTPIRHQYQISSKKKTKIVENTLYFPGWTVFINSRRTELIPERDSGLITFSIPKGQYKVEVLFVETEERKFAKSLSILGIIVVFFSFFYALFRKKA